MALVLKQGLEGLHTLLLCFVFKDLIGYAANKKITITFDFNLVVNALIST